MLAVRHGHVVDAMAYRDRLLGQVLEQLAAHRVRQLVQHLGILGVLGRVLHRAAFQRQHLQPGFGQFLAHDRAGPSETDQHRVHFVFLDRHQPFSPEIDTGP